MNIKKGSILVLFLILALIKNVSVIANTASKENEIWEKIFDVIARNSNDDPIKWLQDQTRKTPIINKGGTHILGYNYYLKLFGTGPQKNKIILDNVEQGIHNYELAFENVYFLSEDGMTDCISKSKLVLIITKDFIFVIDTIHNLIGTIHIHPSGKGG